MFNNVKAGTRLELANGSKATVTEKGARTFFVKPDGGKLRAREYNFDGKTIDERYNVKAILTEMLDAPLTYDFRDGNGAVEAHYHINPDGTKGGIVANTAFIDATSIVGIGSVVFGTASVLNSQVKGNSRVGGDLTIENAVIDGQELLGRTTSMAA
jgi:ADP-glucose pyrophosphorylase